MFLRLPITIGSRVPLKRDKGYKQLKSDFY